MIFRLEASATFQADDLDDALRLLMEHFYALANEQDSPVQFESPSEINLLVLERKTIQ